MRGTDKETSWILASELDMLLNSLQISTLHTQPSLALYQVFPNSDFQPSACSSFLEDHTCFYIMFTHSKFYLL